MLTHEKLTALRAALLLAEDGAVLDNGQCALLKELLDVADKDPGRLMFEMTTEAREAFPNDPSAPGVTVSCLDAGAFYGSICRYLEPFGKGKQVVVGIKGKTFHGTMLGLFDLWARKKVTL